MKTTQFTRYETARIIGARALQIAMNAPLLLKISNEDLEKIKFDAIKIAEAEFNSGVLPISVHRPMPKKREGDLKREKAREVSEKKIEDIEAKEEEDIAKEGEIMELANPEDEQDEEDSDDGDAE